MEKDLNINVLKKCSLFKNVSSYSLIEKILLCTKYIEKKYTKDEYITFAGNKLNRVGIIVEGTSDIVKEDYEGNLNIISTLKAGDIFGEAVIFSEKGTSPVSIIATSQNVIVYYLDIKNIFHKCNDCKINHLIIENLISTLSNKNIILNKKINIISKKSIREKLTAYFTDLCIESNCNTFSLKITKTKLANYLGVDRSAMSREYKNMIDDNIITVDTDNKKQITFNYFEPH